MIKKITKPKHANRTTQNQLDAEAPKTNPEDLGPMPKTPTRQHNKKQIGRPGSTQQNHETDHLKVDLHTKHLRRSMHQLIELKRRERKNRRDKKETRGNKMSTSKTHDN